MGEQDAFERILTSLHNAMLDDARWPGVSARIDETCGLSGNDLIVSEGPKNDLIADRDGHGATTAVATDSCMTWLTNLYR